MAAHAPAGAPAFAGKSRGESFAFIAFREVLSSIQRFIANNSALSSGTFNGLAHDLPELSPDERPRVTFAIPAGETGAVNLSVISDDPIAVLWANAQQHAGPAGGRTLIDDLLAEQRRLTAVEKFSQRHDREDLPPPDRHYRDLLPLSAPTPGKQFAFEVDLDRCSGCKACVTACHSLNGLDEGEAWR